MSPHLSFPRALGALAVVVGSTLAARRGADATAEVDAEYPRAEALYLDLHRHPELSFHETETAAKLAAALRDAGYDVTTGVGRTGIVGVLKNGAGPTVLLRTELDALPVTENTGLPFASTVRTKDDAGADVGVMHACGHDVHMAAWLGTARIMAQQPRNVAWDARGDRTARGRNRVGRESDARRRSPHTLPAARLRARRARRCADAGGAHRLSRRTDSHERGRRDDHDLRPRRTWRSPGCHGGPVVIAARTVVALQTIVSREISPFDPAVVTVGSIHGGTKNNIIPDEVRLQLTVRSFTDPVRKHLLAAIERITRAEAMAAGAPREPSIEYGPPTQALVNDSALTRRVSAALVKQLGATRVKDTPPEMASEDFAEFHLAGVPTLMLRIGAVEQTKYDAAMKSGTPLPSLHSALFAPDRSPTIKSAMLAEVLSLRELMPAAPRPGT